eukprot:TRINITY_DN3049_c0_g1_i1.p2 TRINITY_DN3049_c0_g1~~TRINITY_DN3049_c0_g1_i1.p2  ORF type:complete len:553 (+),score=188.18 TRINITY_DN3049_c0_g1_i1:2345-4003(+)
MFLQRLSGSVLLRVGQRLARQPMCTMSTLRGSGVEGTRMVLLRANQTNFLNPQVASGHFSLPRAQAFSTSPRSLAPLILGSSHNESGHQSSSEAGQQPIVEAGFAKIYGMISLAFTTFFLILLGRSLYGFEESFYFLGEPTSFEKKYNEAMGYEATGLMPQCFTFFITAMLKHVDEHFDPQLVADEMIRAHPDCILGYSMRAYLAKLEGNMKEAFAWLQKADEVAAANPDLAEKMSFLRMTEKDLKKIEFTSEFRELVPGKVWIVKEPVAIHENDDPLLIQSSIAKLQSGELVIINPTDFSPESKRKIDALGPVKAIVTTTAAHGKGAELAQNLWPNAKLYGTDPKRKHDRPHLRWDGFLSNDGKAVFGTELPYHQIEGQIFNEVLFYHRSSHALLGMTDLAIDMKDLKKMSPQDVPWSFRVYMFGLGVWRGPFTRDIETQSYMNAYAYSRYDMRKSFIQTFMHDIKYITLGHGGVIEGDDAVQTFTDHYQWALDPQKESSSFTSVARTFHWAFFVSGIPQNLFSSFFRQFGFGSAPIPPLTSSSSSSEDQQ